MCPASTGAVALQERDEDPGVSGFSLVEVMVVVLIIGALLAVAVPTLAGARQRAFDAAARANLRTAAGAAVDLSQAGADFGLASAVDLSGYEPSLTYVDGSVPSTGPGAVSVDSSSRTRWRAVVQSASGTCFAADIGVTGQTYDRVASCAASDVDLASPGGVALPVIISGTALLVGPVPDGAEIQPDRGYESDTDIHVFTESRATLTESLRLHGGTIIPAGTTVCSYLFFYSPSTISRGTTATFDLRDSILGSARTASELNATRSFGNPNANYQSRAWEPDDGYSANGSQLTLSPTSVVNNADMVRVFTGCP